MHRVVLKLNSIFVNFCVQQTLSEFVGTRMVDLNVLKIILRDPTARIDHREMTGVVN